MEKSKEILEEQADMTVNDADVREGAEKTFTQEQLDKIVADRLAREKKKYADYYDIKADNERLRNDNMTFKELSDLLAMGNVGGTPARQLKVLQDFYGITKNEAQAVVNAGNDDGSKSYSIAQEFNKTASDDEVIAEIDRILDMPAKERTKEDYAKLEVLEQRYGSLKWKSEYDDASKYCSANSDFKLDELMKNEDFLQFVSDSKDPLPSLVKRYLKYTNAKKKEPSNPGSVKDKSGFAEKEYYTKDEVDRLSEKDLENPKVWEKVRKSMTKWK